MSWARRHWLPLVILVVAVVGLIGSAAAVAARQNANGPTTMMGNVAVGQAPVHNLAAARTAADAFGARWGLHAGEVIQFDNGFYAELLGPTGNGATEVLIDPGTGTVAIEYGPAMMWNTGYGMMGGAGPAMMRPYQAGTVIGADQARQIAQNWLSANRPGQQAQDAEAFPGYYTLDITATGRITGMLSVNATTGQVWYHSWHGRFIASQDTT